MNTSTSKKPAQKKGKSMLGKINAWLHLWLGLSSGIIVFIVAITGCMFVFCDDIIDAMAGKARYVQEVKATRLSTEELIARFKKDHPDRTPFSYMVYKDPQRSFKIASEDKNEAYGFTWMNPYTGETLYTSNAYYFFYVVAHVHNGHIPFKETGGVIVHIATWIFLILLVTGLVHWWPKKWNKTTRQSSLNIKWKAGFKRVNYDLHNVPGFYSLLPALLITATGLIIVNKTLNDGLHKLNNSKPEPYAALRKLGPKYNATLHKLPLDTIIHRYMQPAHVQELRMNIPPKDSITFYMMITGKSIGLKAVDGDMMTVNRYTGNPIALPAHIKKGLQLDGLIMNLHIGFWAGWLGKIVALLAGLVAAALPITGFIIWWGRRNKKKGSTKQPIVKKEMAAA